VEFCRDCKACKRIRHSMHKVETWIKWMITYVLTGGKLSNII
jgi:hypothetical protein